MTTLDDAAMDVTETSVQLEQLQATVELLEESLADAQLSLEDRSWLALATSAGEVIPEEHRRRAVRLGRIMSVADPLIRRAVTLRTAYVFGQGVQVAAEQEQDAGQDLNAVIQAFLEDPSNQSTFSSAQAREELERRLETDGENFYALVTNPLTGRVQVRVIPGDEVEDVITNPDDAADPWFYKRTYTRTVVEEGYAGTRQRRETRTVFYPAVGFWPRLRPSTIDGKPVEWDMPVVHTTVNRPEGSLRGIGDVFAALPWAQGYKEFLEDWARLVKALSKIAWRATSTKAGAATARTKYATLPDTGVGGMVVTAPDQRFEAVSKSGATIDSGSGRPLAAMVAAAMDVPVTMLLGDPGVTGARATAETLDQPLQLVIGMRRSLHTSLIVRVLDYVIDQAIKAPRGPLKGTRTVDQVTGREVMTLTGDQSRVIDVDWPSLTKDATKDLVDAIVAADDTGKLPPLEVARMLLVALGQDDIDSILEQLVDDNGDFVYPDDAAQANSAMGAVSRGDLPGTAPPEPEQDPGPDEGA